MIRQLLFTTTPARANEIAIEIRQKDNIRVTTEPVGVLVGLYTSRISEATKAAIVGRYMKPSRRRAA